MREVANSMLKPSSAVSLIGVQQLSSRLGATTFAAARVLGRAALFDRADPRPIGESSAPAMQKRFEGALDATGQTADAARRVVGSFAR